jgi:hypothetical protein
MGAHGSTCLQFQDAEAGKSQVPGQPGYLESLKLQSKTLSHS